ncbi:hypothetical protein PF003_g28733 [Phytophthora fragariae]|nr:hypothetical protein PF003_g28733 [Phytophthora fragariae]
MQRDEQTWRQAIADEEAASAALVEAERVLHLQLQHHRAGSPTVDDAVSEVDLRRTEYAAAVRATDEAAVLYHRAHGEVIAAERDDRRADHVQRIEAVLQQARAAQQHAAATSPSVARRAHSSSSENGSSPRPTKRLNLGPPSSGSPIQTTGGEEDTARSGDSEGESSGGASERADTGRSGGSEGESSGNASERADTARSDDSEGESSGNASERADTGRSGGSEGSSSGNASESPPLPLNRLMPMALLSPQAYGVPPSTPAPTPAEAETQTPEYQPAESDGNEENVESDGNVENVESDGGDEKEESDGNDENAESVESSEFVPSSEAEDSETES